MAEDVLNVNIAGMALTDHNSLSENIVSALKEKDELIYKQWIIISELERKLSQYCPMEEFYTGFAKNFYNMFGSGDANIGSCSGISHKSSLAPTDESILDWTEKEEINKCRLKKSTNLSQPLYYQTNTNHNSECEENCLQNANDNCESSDVHHYENIELKILEEEELQKEEVVSHELSDDSSACEVGVSGTGDDMLVDETSTNFENLLEEFASDAFGMDGNDSFNSGSSSEEDEDDLEEAAPAANGSSNCNSRNSTLRKKQKATSKVIEGENQDLPGAGVVEEHLFGSLSSGGTLRRDHPSISKIFNPNVQSSALFSSLSLSASSPSVFSGPHSSAPLASPGFTSTPSSTCCPCPDCLTSAQQVPLFSHTIQQPNQQQLHNSISPKIMGPIKPLAPLGLEPWRLKMKNLSGFKPIGTPSQDLGDTHHHQIISRHPSLDSSHCNCKVHLYSNGNLSSGSNSSLEQQCHQNHNSEARTLGSWRKTPERISSGSESLSSGSNLSSCLCSCDSSQRCSRCSLVYQTLPLFQSPPSAHLSTHFQFPSSHNKDAFYPYSSALSHYQHHIQNHSTHSVAPNIHPSSQVYHSHHQHYHVHPIRQQQRMGDACTDFYVPLISQNRLGTVAVTPQGSAIRAVSDRGRKRAYRIGLNIFNKKPSKGLEYLTGNKFVEHQPNAVAKFLISRKGISRRMIGQYMGNTQDRFSIEVLKCFAEELDLTGLQIDVALRVFQSQFEISGEAQRIEKFMEAFASRYRECNPHLIGKLFHSSDTIFLLSYAVMMLNTDLHNVNVRPEKKMTLSEFIKNLKGSDDGYDINSDYLTGIYERVKEQEFSPLSDHTSQVVMVDRMIQGKKETLVEMHRRFVCHFRMHEVVDLARNERIGSHTRGLFLFNDLLVITKLSSKKKKNANHHLKYMVSLLGVAVYLLETPHYKFGIRLKSSAGKVLVTLCANSNEERMKFVEDLRESILETEKMEEYLGQVKVRAPAANTYHKENVETLNRYSKDSGVVDVDLTSQPHHLHQLQQQHCKCTDDRRSSRTSVDSGMSSTGSANMTKDAGSGKLNRSLSQKGVGSSIG